MANITTVSVDKSVLRLLKEAREYPRQTYGELIEKMALLFRRAKKANQYDDFLHKIQQQKMRELWDNSDDEAWENV